MIPVNRYTAGAAVWLASILLTAWLVWDYADAKAKADRLAAVERAVEQQRALDAENHEVELAAARQQQETRIVYRDRVRTVTEYVESSERVQCLDPDRVRLFNSISTGVEVPGDGGGPVRAEAPVPDRRD